MELKKQIIRAAHGSNSDSAALVDRFQPLLHAYAKRLGTENGYEELRLKLLEIIHFLANQPSIFHEGKIVSYVETAIRRAYLAKSIKKRAEENRRYDRFDTTEDLELLLANRAFTEDSLCLPEWEDLLHCLSSQERAVVLGIYFHGQTAADLAEAHGCTRQNINQAKQRALKKLRQMLNDEMK